MRAGRLRHKIAFQRYAMVEDEFGSPVPAAAATVIGEPLAEVIYGRGDERREAARESATQPATFRVYSTAMTRGVSVTDEIAFDGGLWDITSNVPLGRDKREITAVRRAA